MSEKYLEVKWRIIVIKKNVGEKTYLQFYAHKFESLGEMHGFLES